MKFNLYFSMDNAVFYDNSSHEVVRILREIADKIENNYDVPRTYQTIRDINGNDIGRYAQKPSE